MRPIRPTSDIGPFLREQRLASGRTAAELAATVGMQRSTLARIESGRMNPTWSLVLGICQALDLQPVLVPRQRMAAVEAVIQMSDAPEVPPLAGEEWD